jgi:ABC-type transporter Mla MlaB component
VAGHPHPWVVPKDPDDSTSLPELSVAFRAALLAPDISAARAMIAEAARCGTAPGRLYVEVVRPVLAELQEPGGGIRARLAAEIGETILIDLLATLPVRRGLGTGRAAVLSCRRDGIEAVDGAVVTEYLAAEGWAVERLAGDTTEPCAPSPDLGAAHELAVAVIAEPRDALRLAPLCAELRRMPDPPVVLVCDFTRRGERRAAVTSLGADAVVADPDDLAAHVAQRLPEPGSRRWGVRLSRAGGDLELAPTGRLDDDSVGRLADVVTSRHGTFDRLVVDLRDLAAIDASGLDALATWPDRLPLESVELTLLTALGSASAPARGFAAPWNVVTPGG